MAPLLNAGATSQEGRVKVSQDSRRQRIETPERRAKALRRAIANGIEVFISQAPGHR
jgi:hypothetical protein